jgi:poly(3-hydroxybutyrate) depolymerase
MSRPRMIVQRSMVSIAAVLLLASPVGRLAGAQTLDDSIAPGNNFDKAQFRLWYPRDVGTLRAVLVLVPGSNGDGRGMADDSTWQSFATRNKLAIVACRFTDKPHDQSFIEHYVNVSQGSGQALLDGLAHLAERSRHPEIASAPLLFWGMSAGGEFNYEFAAWKPERVVAFVVNKGGIYYSALTSRATRQVPAMLFIGGKDLESRINTITGLFAVNRRGGALWALAEEPGAGHIVGRSRDLSIMFFDDVLPLRLVESSTTLKPMTEAAGYLGDFKTKKTEAVADTTPTPYLTAWFPTARVARAWQALVTERPFEQ